MNCYQMIYNIIIMYPHVNNKINIDNDHINILIIIIIIINNLQVLIFLVTKENRVFNWVNEYYNIKAWGTWVGYIYIVLYYMEWERDRESLGREQRAH